MRFLAAQNAEEACTEIIRDAVADYHDSLEGTKDGYFCPFVRDLANVKESNSDPCIGQRYFWHISIFLYGPHCGFTLL